MSATAGFVLQMCPAKPSWPGLDRSYTQELHNECAQRALSHQISPMDDRVSERSIKAAPRAGKPIKRLRPPL
jgi:hypothetical protein